MEHFGQSLPEQIAERIAQRILEGELQLGSRLKEASLAEEFGTSRAPIREALYILTLQGLVERMPRKGAVVKSYTSKELTQLYQVRCHLEEFALSEISLPLSDYGKQAFNTILDQMGNAVKNKDFHEYANLNMQFHRTLFDLADNKILASLYDHLEIPLQFLLKLSVGNEQTLVQSHQEHQQIVSLLFDGQRDKALEALKQHDLDSLSRVSKYVSRFKENN
ncbi:GntR family transcriptional regulator [Effusibacillus dendaii]|uniref:GntR family transcriptional regulator n=1 Tax=Effusibacillus dendaii TaxID=2743772 RepID=A0A7I8D773_9BACL|nr:GntR family transcriptional regulator [Effusibacillus dendaii]BCJ86008.1 GntR family transcriptional regulator [Effusibacillus dendaii]